MQQLLTAYNQTPQIVDVADWGTRMNALEEEQLRSIERAETGQIPLIKQSFPDRAVGLSGESPDGLLRIPIRSKQVGPEVSDNGVLGRGGNKLDHRKPVSDRIMIIRRQHGTNFECWPATPTTASRKDLPDTVHLEMSVQGELIAQPEQLVLAAGGHLAYANPGQIGCRQGGDTEFRSGQDPAGKHLVKAAACPPDCISLGHGLIVPSRLQRRLAA
jgi:hypothetical protein